MNFTGEETFTIIICLLGLIGALSHFNTGKYWVVELPDPTEEDLCRTKFEIRMRKLIGFLFDPTRTTSSDGYSIESSHRSFKTEQEAWNHISYLKIQKVQKKELRKIAEK